MERDTQQRFIFENGQIRGEIVRLNRTFEAILERHDYPVLLRPLLGQILATAALLNSIIKYEGHIIVQIQSEKRIKLLLGQCDHKNHVRGLARWEDELTENDIKNFFSSAQMGITIQRKDGSPPTQGIVSLHSGHLAIAIEHYFSQSEQLPTRLYFAADDKQVVGFLLQTLPTKSMHDDLSFWQHITTLSDTITQEELLTLSNTEILYRLFHEETLSLFESKPISFQCHCSLESMQNAIRIFGYNEAKQVIKEDGVVTVNCEFCNAKYDFDAIDVEKLFRTNVASDLPKTTH